MGTRRIFRRGGGAQNVKYPPCLASPWDSVGGVGQGKFCILHKSGIDSPVLWRSPGLSSGRVCWDCWQYGRSAWALALSGAQAGRRSYTVIFWPFLFPSPFSPLFPLLPVSGAVPWVVLVLLSGWWFHGLGLAVLWPPAGRVLLGWLWVQALAACFSLALLPLPSGCRPWALVLLSPSVLPLGCWRSSAVLWCWPAMCWAWVPVLGGVGAGDVQAVAVVAGWWLVCVDLAGCWFVMLHKYSLADLVIIQGKSDKF